MTTTTLHANVQRSRFAHLALSALTGLIPGARTRRDPAGLSRAERASLEAQSVRELAQGYARTDPGFASDLYAAAARHEGLNAE